MKLAIIGAPGMLGQHALHAVLAAAHQVRVTFRHAQSLKKLSIQPTEHVKTDLSDTASLAAAMRGCDAVINASGYYPTTPRKWQDDVALARAEQQRFIGAVEKSGIAKEALGYAPSVMLEETVRRTLAWMASQHMVPK